MVVSRAASRATLQAVVLPDRHDGRKTHRKDNPDADERSHRCDVVAGSYPFRLRTKLAAGIRITSAVRMAFRRTRGVAALAIFSWAYRQTDALHPPMAVVASRGLDDETLRTLLITNRTVPLSIANIC